MYERRCRQTEGNSGEEEKGLGGVRNPREREAWGTTATAMRLTSGYSENIFSSTAVVAEHTGGERTTLNFNPTRRSRLRTETCANCWERRVWLRWVPACVDTSSLLSHYECVQLFNAFTRTQTHTSETGCTTLIM